MSTTKEIGGRSGTGRLIDVNEAQGIRRYYHEDASTGQMGVETVQDVSGIVDGNKRLANIIGGRHFNLKGMALNWVGRVPLNILAYLQKSGIFANPERMREWLLDPDNRAWLFKKF